MYKSLLKPVRTLGKRKKVKFKQNSNISIYCYMAVFFNFFYPLKLCRNLNIFAESPFLNKINEYQILNISGDGHNNYYNIIP
jgi:hypothetical protein